MNIPKDLDRLDRSSASSFSIDVLCPGRQNLLKLLPPSQPNTEPTEDDEQALRGVKLHEAWRTGNFAELDTEELDDYERGWKFKEQSLIQFAEDFKVPGIAKVVKEERLWLHDERTMKPILSGQMDEYGYVEQYGYVLDYKSGWNPNITTSERNWQLRVYAVLVWKEHPELTTIRVGFVKPKGMGGPDFTDYSAEDLARSERDIRFHLWKTEQPDAQRVPGPHCRWCPAKAFCKEAAAMSLLPSVAIDEPAAMRKEDITALVGLMPLPDLAFLHRRASIIGKILDEVKARLKSLPVDELTALGFGFGKGRTMDSIDNTKDCFEALKEFGINEEEIWKAMKFSKGELIDALRRDQGWPKAKADGFVKQYVENFGSSKTSDAPLVSL